ncbi:hypothetical protein MTR67_004533 [Solanum verrucosum]|uniref:Bax inhibitor 1 n=1 Tax=Solanum verrucosum TaxID=315347 RepID=A0AAF0PUQ3_SOLVR|nr:hypothetical protein MTR67_004533 [Solanum verrucosum]
MKLLDMKLRATNAVRAYFNRNWTREDLMNFGEIPEIAYRGLKRFAEIIGVSYSLMCHAELYFWILLALVLGRGRAVHSPFFCSKFTRALLYITNDNESESKVSLLMITAFFFGTSIGFYTKYLFVVHQNLVFSFLAGSIMGIGILWFGSLLSRERREIYMACLVHSYALMYSSFMLNALEALDSHTAHWVLEVTTVQALFLGYLVVYSQEMLYDAGFGEINFVDRTLTVFFHLPAIVVHAARLY